MNALITLSRQIEDMNRRLRIMEGTQRSGLGSIKFDGTQAAQTLSTYGTNNWSNLSGNAPEVTMSTGSRVVIIASFRPVDVANVATYTAGLDFKSTSLVMGIGIDSTGPHEFASPTMRSQYSIVVNQEGDQVSVNALRGVTLATFRDDLEPGEHTFKMLFYADETYPAGAIDPEVDDMSLIVLPLGYS